MDVLERLTDPWALLGYVAAALFFAQRVFDALEYFGKVPARFQSWTRKRIAERAAERAQEQAESKVLRQLVTDSPVLAELVGASRRILEQVTPNGGQTERLGDAVARTEAKVDAIARSHGELADEFHAMKRTMDATITLAIDGDGKGGLDG